MARSINQVILMGRLTRDPEMRTTTTGKNVCNFSLAVDKFGQDAGADFFDIVAWEKLAELVTQYLSKGRRCLVQGRLSQNQWEQDGQKRSRVEIVATDVTFLDGPSGGGGTPATIVDSKTKSSKPKEDVVPEAIDEEEEIDLSDIPF